MRVGKDLAGEREVEREEERGEVDAVELCYVFPDDVKVGGPAELL